MKKQILHYAEVDHAWYESAEKCAYGISNNNSQYVAKKDRTKDYSVISKNTQKVLFTGKSRLSCQQWIEKKTGKSVQFVSVAKFESLQ